jgi:hypothetical protein
MATGARIAHMSEISLEMEQSPEKRMHFCISSKKRKNNTVINKIIIAENYRFLLMIKIKTSITRG